MDYLGEQTHDRMDHLGEEIHGAMKCLGEEIHGKMEFSVATHYSTHDKIVYLRKLTTSR